MSIRDLKVTAKQIAEKGVIASPDTLTGTPDENKKVFDRLASEVLVPSVNGAIEMLGTVEDDTIQWAEEEAQRQANESARVTAEQARDAAETERDTAEQGRAVAETARDTAEQERASTESARAAAEQGRVEAESLRTTAEQGRAAAETVRSAAEQGRVSAESGRAAAEQMREQAEQQRADETAGIVAQATAQAQSAAADAALAESWAKGGTGTRIGEETDNAAYYANQALAGAQAASQQAETAMQSASSAQSSKTAAQASEAAAAASAATADASKTQAQSAAERAAQAAEDAEAIAGGDFIPSSQKGAANGVAALDPSGKVPTTQLPELNYDPAGTAQIVANALSIHVKDMNNPHGVTAEQTGAVPTSEKGSPGGIAPLDWSGTVPKSLLPDMGGKRAARFTIGTSTAGWTSEDCDYLCDGTDDQTEINNVIQVILEEGVDDGGEIVLLDGVYYINSPIIVNRSNVKLSGNGKCTVIKQNSAFGDAMIDISGSFCSIQNLQVYGYSTAASKGVVLAGEGGIISGCTFMNHSVAVTSDCGLCIIANNAFNANEDGLYLTSFASKNTIVGNLFFSNYNYGITGNQSSHNTISGNTCDSNRIGIMLTSTCQNNTISGNTCSNNETGISLPYGDGNTVCGNTCFSNSSDGISVSYGTNNTITGNTCNKNSKKGITLSGSNSGNTIAGNTLNGNNTGIYLAGSSLNNNITGNTVYKDGEYAATQYTIYLYGRNNNGNLIACNQIFGKDYTSDGGTNMFVDNLFEL